MTLLTQILPSHLPRILISPEITKQQTRITYLFAPTCSAAKCKTTASNWGFRRSFLGQSAYLWSEILYISAGCFYLCPLMTPHRSLGVTLQWWKDFSVRVLVTFACWPADFSQNFLRFFLNPNIKKNIMAAAVFKLSLTVEITYCCLNGVVFP